MVSVESLTLLLLDIGLRNGSTVCGIRFILYHYDFHRDLLITTTSVELACWSSPPLKAIDNVVKIYGHYSENDKESEKERGRRGKRNRLRLCQLFTRNHGNARFQVTIKAFQQ